MEVTLARDIDADFSPDDISEIDDATTTDDVHEIIESLHIDIGDIEGQLKYCSDRSNEWRAHAISALAYKRTALSKAHNKLKRLKGSKKLQADVEEAARMRRELNRQNTLAQEANGLERKRIADERQRLHQINQVIDTIKRGRFERCFVAVARETLSPDQFREIAYAAEEMVEDTILKKLLDVGFEPSVVEKRLTRPVDGAD